MNSIIGSAEHTEFIQRTIDRKTMNLRDKAVTIATEYGFKHNTTKSTSKYACYEHPNRPDKRLFIGSRAAVRIGYTASQSHAFKGTAFSEKMLHLYVALCRAICESEPRNEKGQRLNSPEVEKSQEVDQRKQALKEEQTKLHQALRGVEPVYLVELFRYEKYSDEGIFPVVFASEEFTELDKAKAFARSTDDTIGYHLYVRMDSTEPHDPTPIKMG